MEHYKELDRFSFLHDVFRYYAEYRNVHVLLKDKENTLDGQLFQVTLPTAVKWICEGNAEYKVSLAKYYKGTAVLATVEYFKKQYARKGNNDIDISRSAVKEYFLNILYKSYEE